MKRACTEGRQPAQAVPEPAVSLLQPVQTTASHSHMAHRALHAMRADTLKGTHWPHHSAPSAVCLVLS